MGLTEGLQRSHAEMEGQEQPASPTWSLNHISNTSAPSISFHSSLPLYHDYEPAPHYHNYDDQEPPAFDPVSRLSSIFDPVHPHGPPQSDRPSPTSAPRPHHSGLHLPQVGNMASSAPRRFAGDGLDYRRPAGSAREQDAASVDLTAEEEDLDDLDDLDDMAIDLSRDDDIIDLTADDSGYGASRDGNPASQSSNGEGQQQHLNPSRPTTNGAPRLPRGMDIIIDLDNGDEEWRIATPQAPEPGSPEIEFISSRRIDPPHRDPLVFARNNPDADEVEFLRENALPPEEARRRRSQELHTVMDLLGTMNGRFTHLRAQVDRFNAQINRTADRLHRGPVVPPRAPTRAHAHIRVGAFVAPTLDFNMLGFDMGIPGARAAEPPPPTYEAPVKAPEGFTRSPEEKDVLVCPNCEGELCVGQDEVKKQVWIVKGCGHVSSLILSPLPSVCVTDYFSGLLR